MTKSAQENVKSLSNVLNIDEKGSREHLDEMVRRRNFERAAS
jgi:predicted ArsR family transcriptional regulator